MGNIIADYIRATKPEVVDDLLNELATYKECSIKLNGVACEPTEILNRITAMDFNSIEIRSTHRGYEHDISKGIYLTHCTDFPEEEQVYHTLCWILSTTKLLKGYLQYTNQKGNN